MIDNSKIPVCFKIILKVRSILDKIDPVVFTLLYHIYLTESSLKSYRRGQNEKY